MFVVIHVPYFSSRAFSLCISVLCVCACVSGRGQLKVYATLRKLIIAFHNGKRRVKGVAFLVVGGVYLI
jgi:hypothetical protein